MPPRSRSRSSPARADALAEAEPVTEPQPGQPHGVPQPPDAVQHTGASNASGELPQNAMAGAARATAWFERVIEAATGTGDPAEALVKIAEMARRAHADVRRFVPAGMHQAAHDHVTKTAGDLQ